jgi:hypothetical protein
MIEEKELIFGIENNLINKSRGKGKIEQKIL